MRVRMPKMPRRLLRGPLSRVRKGEFSLPSCFGGDSRAALRRLLAGLKDLEQGDVHRRLAVTGAGPAAELARTFNEVAGQNQYLTEEVASLNRQVREVSRTATAVARGDLEQKITIPVTGEMAELKNSLNTMVDRLSTFADEVTRVAREVGTEGKLGGQANVEGVSGTWQALTDNVNQLAANLTTQVRAIAAVATAVTKGDLTQKITVDASGEVAELKHDINQMITKLEETTRAYLEQDWLKTNLARLSGAMQGHRDVTTLASRILSELAPLVSAQQGAVFLAQSEVDGEGTETTLVPVGRYGAPPGQEPGAMRFRLGESLVGQAAVDRKTILVTDAPPGYARISSGVGTSAPANVVVLPVLFEGQTLCVIELASIHEFTKPHLDLLEQFRETIGVNVNTILVNSQTETLLAESRRLAEQLQAQQEELRRSNTELAEKAALLVHQKRDIESKNTEITEIEQARKELEELAARLSTASRYKSEFIASMSHELRSPLNSALMLAGLLADNVEGNLTPQQVEYVRTIYAAGSDLLQLINDILDLAKIEAGHLDVVPVPVEINELVNYVETLYQPMAAEKGLDFSVAVSHLVPQSLETDQTRLQQILRNLLSNALKFTEQGSVRLDIRMVSPSEVSEPAMENASACVAFTVQDTGIGIPDEKLDVIFDKFQQAESTTNRKYGGTGLGLAICRELALLLGGELRVVSKLGEGSIFTLYVPIKRDSGNDQPSLSNAATPHVSASPGGSVDSAPETRADLPEPRYAERGAPQAISDRYRFRGEKVLVIDDDPRTVFAVTALLEQHGLNVLSADNGTEGIELLHQERDIALVLLDLMMPGMDGRSATAEIRGDQRFADVPVIVLTANAMKDERARTLESGATDYIIKPITSEHLMPVIAKYLPSRAMRG